MKILQLGPVPRAIGGNDTGGVATHTWELSQSLSSRGHDVAILADNFVDITNYTVHTDGVRIYPVSPICMMKSMIHRSALSNFKNIWSMYGKSDVTERLVYGVYSFVLSQVLNHYNPDIIHAHHLRNRFAVAEAVRNDIPIVGTVHSVHSVEFAHNDVEKIREYRLMDNNLKNSGHVIFVSDKLRKECEKMFQHAPETAHTVHNPVRIPEKYPRSPPESYHDSEYDVLSVGSLNGRKGADTLLKAAESLTNTKDRIDNVNFHVVGTGDEEKKLKNYAERNSIDNVSFYGYVENIKKFYAHADLFVLPTRSESFGLVYIESMAAGTPVIGTTAVPEAVIPDENVGFRVRPNAPEKLSEYIIRSLNNDWDAGLIRSFAEGFSWERNVHEFEDIYRVITGNMQSNGLGPTDYK